MPDSTLSTLEQIRIKIRRLTRNPSAEQISNADIDDYVNTFILYDMPASIKIESMKEVLSFYTQPYIEEYSTNTTDPNDTLYNFKNRYVNVAAPVYVAGRRSRFVQSVEEMLSLYPMLNEEEQVDEGDGIISLFTGNISSVPIIRNQVTISSVDANGSALIARDDGQGGFQGDVAIGVALNTINYQTGAFNVGFSLPPGNGEPVYASYVTYVSGRPDSVLFYSDSFIVRPIPDKTYKIDITAYRRPTELINASDMPQYSELFQYISYGAAIKILQDRMDTDSASILMPEFNKQEILATRRVTNQNSGKRVPTIFSDSNVIDYPFGINN